MVISGEDLQTCQYKVARLLHRYLGKYSVLERCSLIPIRYVCPLEHEYIVWLIWQYFVTVAPGVDLALVAAICICFDEAKNDKNN